MQGCGKMKLSESFQIYSWIRSGDFRKYTKAVLSSGQSTGKEEKIFNVGCTKGYWKPVLQTIKNLLKSYHSVMLLKVPGRL